MHGIHGMHWHGLFVVGACVVAAVVSGGGAVVSGAVVSGAGVVGCTPAVKRCKKKIGVLKFKSYSMNLVLARGL